MKRWPLGRVVRLLVAIVLLGWMLRQAHPLAVWRAAERARPAWIALAVLLAILDRVVMAYRWLVLLCPLDDGSRPPFGEVMRIFFTSTFVGTVLPGGGDIPRVYALSRLNVAAGTAVASVLMDRLLGVLSIVLVGAGGLLLARGADLASNRTIALSLTVAAAICTTGALVVFSARIAGWAQRAAGWLPFARLRKLAADVTGATRAYSRFHGELTNVLLGSIAVQVLRIVQTYCLGRALSIDASVAVYFALVPLILLIVLLPVSINGIGTTQVAFVWFFARAGTPQADAFALSVLFLALSVVGNLPGGFLYISGRSASPV